MKKIGNSLSVKCISLLFFITYPIISKAQNSTLAEADKKTLLTNLSKIIAAVKTDFATLKKGESYLDGNNTLSWQSAAVLFPAYTSNENYLLYFHSYNGKSMPTYTEKVPVDIYTILAVITSFLKSKGFVEVDPRGLFTDWAGKCFKSNETVIQLSTDVKAAKANTTIDIGKLHYYYEKNSLVDVSNKLATNNKAQKVVVPIPDKTNPSIKNEKPASTFNFEDPCGFKANGTILPGDSIVNGRISSYCTSNDYNPTSFTGTFRKGKNFWNYEERQGNISFNLWKINFTGDFIKETPTSSIWAIGYLKINGDSILGFLHRTTSYEPKYSFTPKDKNRQQIKFYANYDNTNLAKVVYESNTIAQEEQAFAEAQQRLRYNNQNGTGSSNNASTKKPATKLKVDPKLEAEMTTALDNLNNWLQRSDPAGIRDLTQCSKDMSYGESIASMSGHCKRANLYLNTIIDKCNDFLKKYEKYAPAEVVSVVNERRSYALASKAYTPSR